MTKVVIVGAGPAGLMAGISILNRFPSYDVLLIEKESHIGKPVRCAGGLGSWLDIPDDIKVHALRKIKFFTDNDFFEVTSEEVGLTPLGWTIDREKFDKWLFGKYMQLGGRVKTGDLVKGVNFNKSRIFIRHYDHDYNYSADYDYLVGAGGTAGIVGRELGVKYDIIPCIQYYVDKVFFFNFIAEIYFSKYMEGGYAWVFPGKNSYVRVGLGTKNTNISLKSRLENFIEKRFNNFELKGVAAKPLPYGKPVKNPARGNVFLAGDTAGSIEPFTGGGIKNAMLSGLMVGMSGLNTKKYNKLWNGYIYRQNLVKHYVSKFLHSTGRYDLFLKLLKRFKGTVTKEDLGDVSRKWIVERALSI